MNILRSMIEILHNMPNNRIEKRIRESFGKRQENQTYKLDSINSYDFYVRSYSDTSKQIDEITWNDLDMDRVFRSINACNSSVGEEYLYHILHAPNFEEGKLRKREKLIGFLQDNPDIRLKLQICLLKLGKRKYNGLSSFIFNSKSKMLKYTFLYNILTIIPFLCIGVVFLNSTAGWVSLVVSMMVNSIIYYRIKLKNENEFTAISYFTSMLWSCNEILKIKGDELKEHINGLKDDYVVFKSLRGKMSALMQRGASELDFILDYFKMVSLYDIRKYNTIVKRIQNNSESFRSLFKEFGEVDIAICILSYRQSLDINCKPRFSDKNQIEYEDLYHPLVISPILNSGITNSHTLITGPNASGKSTFIKALAVNSILAQTIYTCTAKRFVLRFSLVMTSMAVRDNLTKGESYFITEIKSLKRIIDKIEHITCTCFIDEILKGTNTIERIAASSSILNYLYFKDCMSVIATHDIELTEIMRDKYTNNYFSESIMEDGVIFDFKLKHGVSKSSNAIRLLSFLGFDKKIIDDAQSSVDKFLSTRSWK